MRGWIGKQGSSGGEREPVHGHTATPGKHTLTEGLPSQEATAGGGQAAPDGVRSKVEAATGADLSGVRVHDDARSHEATAAAAARAFTVGPNIFLSPGVRSDDRVMAHELAHTIQQRDHASPQAKPLDVTAPGDAAEVEADRVADAALAGRHAGPVTQQPAAIARVPQPGAQPAQQPAPVPSTEVSRRLTQTMTAGTGSWNNTFGWDSKMNVAVDGPRGIVTTTVRLYTTAPQATRTTWESAIESRWSRRFDLLVTGLLPGDTQRYVIVIDVVWVDRQSDAHYTIQAIDPAHPPPNRTLGRGGTVSMTEWGTGGAQDIPHEFGHMLGNFDEYNTVNGVNQGAPNRADGNVMNNPDNLPTSRHYDGIRRAAASVLGINEAVASVRATAGPPAPVGAPRRGDHLPDGQDGPLPMSPPGTAVA
jgi:hypothetical protein